MNVQTQMRLPLAGPLRAGSFLVTLFGDVVAPRGGEVGIREVIAFCAPFGLSETLIRTAMSRLVAAGQVQGLRQGRRSYYALTDQARAEYMQAAEVIYGSPTATRWRFLFFPQGGAAQHLAAMSDPGFVPLSEQFALGPARGDVSEQAIAFTAEADVVPEALREMVAQLWSLEALASEYQNFSALARQIDRLEAPEPGHALALRVLLVHAYREIALRDPRLPTATLPADWPGHAARKDFAALYLRLSPAADSAAARQFASATGALPQATPATRARRSMLQRIVSE